MIIGYKCTECGFKGKFNEFSTWTYYDYDPLSGETLKDAVHICPKCEAENDYIEEWIDNSQNNIK